MGGLLIYPWLWSLYLSFHTWSLVSVDPIKFVGLENYIDIFSDSRFQLALKNTLLLTVTSVLGQFFLGFILALILNSISSRSANICLVILMIPMMLTPSIVSMVWRLLLHPEWGVISKYYLKLLNLPNIGFLTDPSVCLYTISLIEIWQWTPFSMLILYAGLQALPKEPFEAAKVDGASDLQSFYYITLPYLRPLIVIILLFSTIRTLRAFDTIQSMFFGGGPGNSTLVLGVYLYENFQQTWELGKSSAISYSMLMLTILFTLGFFIRLYKRID